MDIREAHKRFRAIAQQQGMQTIRAILPESIDIALNDAIINKVRSIVLDNTTTVYRDKFISQKNPISPINSIRTLYKLNKVTNVTGVGSLDEPYNIVIDFDDDVMFYTGIVNYYNKNKSYSCRLLEGEELENTMNDYCNMCDWDTPVADIRSDNNDNTIVDIYTNNDIHIPKSIGIRYIKKPNIVKWSEDVNELVNPNVPDHLMPEIIAMAVNQYLNSVGSTNKSVNN